MRVYNISEARQNFASILDFAKKEGSVCINRRDGDVFFIKPAKRKNSPLDVKGINIKISAAEIVDIVNEGRKIIL